MTRWFHANTHPPADWTVAPCRQIFDYPNIQMSVYSPPVEIRPRVHSRLCPEQKQLITCFRE